MLLAAVYAVARLLVAILVLRANAEAERDVELLVAAAGGESATLAEGIACRQPIHGRTLLGDLRSSGGSAVTGA